jgi:hypothetical protein
MHAKIHRYGACVLFFALALGCAAAGMPAGLREALAEFETGTTSPVVSEGDYAVGRHKEVSRFQIRPEIWQEYSESREYHDPDAAWSVAVRILEERKQAFCKATNRDWDSVDIYLMWNAPGSYQRANWERERLSATVLKRAQRFANLMQERESRRVAAKPVSSETVRQ